MHVYADVLPRNAGQNHYIMIANTESENVAKFKIFIMTVPDQTCIHDELKRGLNMGNACYHSVGNLLSCLQSRTVKKPLKTQFFLYFCMGVKLSLCN
jgi:hypothetical protein